ncbi:D-2-hydroxyacid dehydrogenase [Alteromonas sp. 5E99-2]|uniref:D-2-hydroxyacid dehydrogenase n=1 Tax=Alteromonas sp. 5E99-2 TaxID=2817683 RepID=UPI001A99DAF5|nr:D-2-hydroxyacid dehydrogenase [Alteromonas sp. 5E99-2]MBO1254332.1 D-2-hydroxyacid dehydrogenase [Alteromonas sp. 5E99-2]
MLTSKKIRINLSICSQDAEELNALLANDERINIVQLSDNPADLDPLKVEVLLASPNLAAQCVNQCNQLTWLQSTWAGNAPLTSLNKRDYTLTVAGGIFNTQIREYVFTYLLNHVRKVFEIERQRDDGSTWQGVLPNYLSGKTLGVLGTGSLAQALIPAAEVFGLNMIGLSRSGKNIKGFTQVFALEDKLLLAEQADFVVSLLPDTAQTTHLLDNEFFQAMKFDSLLINAGRGNVIDEQALIDNLARNKPSKAVLDVFEQEPLPSSHPFWHSDNIHITHHTAAITRVEDVVDLFLKNVDRYINGQPLYCQLDWNKGY